METRTKQRLIEGPWSFRQGLIVLITFIVLYFALSALHMFWVKNTIGFDAYLGDGPRLSPAFLITNQLLKAVTLLGVIWLIALKVQNLNWRAVGFIRCHYGWLLAAAAVTLTGFVLNLFLAKAMVATLPDWAKFAAPHYAWNDAPAPLMLSLIGITIFVTPIAEEVFFRGFLFQWMATYRLVWLAVIISSAMFGASHIIPSQAISAAAMSILITLLYIGSRSIWPCILCHVLNNAIGVLLGMAAIAGLLPPFLTPPAAA